MEAMGMAIDNWIQKTASAIEALWVAKAPTLCGEDVRKYHKKNQRRNKRKWERKVNSERKCMRAGA